MSSAPSHTPQQRGSRASPSFECGESLGCGQRPNRSNFSPLKSAFLSLFFQHRAPVCRNAAPSSILARCSARFTLRWIRSTWDGRGSALGARTGPRTKSSRCREGLTWSRGRAVLGSLSFLLVLATRGAITSPRNAPNATKKWNYFCYRALSVIGHKSSEQSALVGGVPAHGGGWDKMRFKVPPPNFSVIL